MRPWTLRFGVRFVAYQGIALHFLLPLLIGFCQGSGWAAELRIVTAARDFQEPTHTTHRQGGGLLVYLRGLPGSCCAQDATAFFQIACSFFRRAFSFRRRFSSSYRCSSLTSFSWRSAR